MTETAPPLGRTGKLGEVFKIALPLIMSASIFAFKLFSDRIMLAWYSERSIAAALSAGVTAFMLCSFFMGIANYSSAFVAQYSGAERHDRIGLAVWQSILFSMTAGLILTAAAPFIAPLFSLSGHAPEQAREEEAYFLVLMSGTVFNLINSSLMCFWTGRNKTWTVVMVGAASISLNVCANWILIFGATGSRHLTSAPWPLSAIGNSLNQIAAHLAAPTMGVVGAGIATIATDAMTACIFLFLFLRRRNRAVFGTLPRRVFNPSLLWRMLRFGFGNGMQMFLDVGAFAVFNLIMGAYGVVAGLGNVGAASSIAISVNGTAFVPMLGLGAAASIMVGHGIGSRDIPYAIRAVKSARILILAYMACMCAMFEIFPEQLVPLFGPEGGMNPETQAMAVNFLRFAGAYSITDGVFILYGNAIRGAGDTKFAMYVMGLCGWFLFAIPCFVAFKLGASPYVLWAILVGYCFVAAAILYLRYRQGKWQDMKVIEETGSQRRRAGAASVRLSTPVCGGQDIFTIPGEDEDRPGQSGAACRD